MSTIDSELSLLKQKLASLEEQKRIENEKQLYELQNPMNILEEIIIKKYEQIARNSYSKSIPLARFYDEEKLAMLSPIFNALKNIQERLYAIEKKSNR